MTTNQTIDGVLVSRDMLERLIDRLSKAQMFKESTELRALLDADKVNNRQMGLMQYVEAHPVKPVAQPQGEPVALFESVIGKNPQAFLTEPVYQVTESEVREFARLLAEQPAPVATVLPERSNAVVSANVSAKQAYALGWNACLDEVARLNAAQPVPVAAALPVDPERERLMEIVQQYPNVDPLKYDAAVRTLRK